MGLRFYYSSILPQLPALEYALVETETVQRDMACVLSQWFPHAPAALVAKGFPALNGPGGRPRPASLDVEDEANRDILRAALREEYDVRSALRQHASVCRAAPPVVAAVSSET